MSQIDHTALWLTMIGLGLGSFGLRFIFLGLIGDRALPEWVQRHLRYTSVAVLPAIVAPLIAFPAATGGTPDLPRTAAATVTLAVGYFTKNVIAAIGTGAATLYLLLYLVG
ncbi:AzlD domain-containing protein [Donghicola tyrosinivorans]|uniref:Branched-subunit amino acid transport protein n=1 Tax=Donghicola tyrosinivorans TaxID=1652492 RepID=A0A2T0X000_9RHOB|nr:AzlD domain-containing protein [Donghicola tyrosinivorans]PRY92269.1 branched-subunit amino acid transport protein [Donghicola tyrosinivorans]